jgi:hypothetical protein
MAVMRQLIVQCIDCLVCKNGPKNAKNIALRTFAYKPLRLQEVSIFLRSSVGSLYQTSAKKIYKNSDYCTKYYLFVQLSLYLLLSFPNQFSGHC